MERGDLYTRRLETPEGERTWEVHSLPAATEDDVTSCWATQVFMRRRPRQVAMVAKALAAQPHRMQEIEAIGTVLAAVSMR